LDTFDFIVIGAGSAGCVLADRLSESATQRVLVLEAGGSDQRFWIKAPIGYGMSFYNAAVNWKYTTEPVPGLGQRTSYWPRGKVWGGSSSINAMVYCRGLPADYDDWHGAGNPGWAWRDVRPVFERFERKVGADGVARGNGALFVSNREAQYHPLKNNFRDAARQLQLPLSSDINGNAPEGLGAYPITTKNGLRCSSADAFLRPALARKNVTLRSHAQVHRILFKDQRAIGVQYSSGPGSALTTVYATKEIVLAAGAVNSPQILQLSGIGPAALLQAHGIPIVFANDAVGAGLQDHLGINYTFSSKVPTLNGVLGSWAGRMQAGLQFLLQRQGPLSIGVNQMGGMVRTDAALARPNVQLYFSPISYSATFVNQRPLLRPDSFPGFILGFNPCRPHSQGHVRIRSSNPLEAPKIEPNYLGDPRDLADVLAGAQLIARLQQTPAMQALIDAPKDIDLASASLQSIEDDFRQRSGTVYHPCGTCAMRPLAGGGVVDAQLRVYGVEGLRVADASIFPTITSANTNAPAILVGHQAARFILAPT
jgi:choline dehydrogenase